VGESSAQVIFRQSAHIMGIHEERAVFLRVQITRVLSIDQPGISFAGDLSRSTHPFSRIKLHAEQRVTFASTTNSVANNSSKWRGKRKIGGGAEKIVKNGAVDFF